MVGRSTAAIQKQRKRIVADTRVCFCFVLRDEFLIKILTCSLIACCVLMRFVDFGFFGEHVSSAKC